MERRKLSLEHNRPADLEHQDPRDQLLPREPLHAEEPQTVDEEDIFFDASYTPTPSMISSFIDKIKKEGLRELSPDRLIALSKDRDDMVKHLSELISKASKEEIPYLEELKSKLINLVIPVGKGGRIRFDNAVFNVSSRMEDPVISKGWVTFIKTAIGPILKKMFLSKASYLQYLRAPRNELFERAGIRSTEDHRMDIKNQDIAEVQSYLSKLVNLDAPTVATIAVPGHVMLMVVDPQKNTYRFFDPNEGIFKFQNKEDFIYFTTNYINNKYNHAALTEKRVPKAQMESSLNQEIKPNELAMGFGVCASLSAHVARWFLMHPDFEGNVGLEKLGLSEFKNPSVKDLSPYRYLMDSPAGEAPGFFVEISPLQLAGNVK